MTDNPETVVRAAHPGEIEALAQLWLDGWRDAHLEILPAGLADLRTLASFTDRLTTALPDVRVCGPEGSPTGFYLIKGDELNQIYVDRAARGGFVARALLAAAEAQFRLSGIDRPWLACAIGNLRAARFYEKCGWTRTGIAHIPTETSFGPFPLDVWRYEKRFRD